jgi:sugar lactone lactonase YvrE
MRAGPSGLKIAADGRILVADDKHGLMELDAKAGRMQPLLTARNSESFRGCNDQHPATNGDIHFSDQGQTGRHDPTGDHVVVFAPNGKLIARIRSCAGPACTNVAIGGKDRDRLHITESATGTVLVADISALDRGEQMRRV